MPDYSTKDKFLAGLSPKVAGLFRPILNNSDRVFLEGRTQYDPTNDDGDIDLILHPAGIASDTSLYSIGWINALCADLAPIQGIYTNVNLTVKDGRIVVTVYVQHSMSEVVAPAA